MLSLDSAPNDNSPLRLLAALALSTAIHATALTIDPESSVHLAHKPKPVQVVLTPQKPPEAQAVRVIPSISPEAPPLQSAPPLPQENPPEEVTETPAHLASPLDLSDLESMEQAGPVQLVLRVYVSRLGKLQRIEVLEKNRVTPDFLGLVLEYLSEAPMVAAMTKDGPIASSFDIVIEAKPLEAGEKTLP